MTDLFYLGEAKLSTLEHTYREHKVEHPYAFGWATIEYPDSTGKRHPQRCMVAWVPGYESTEFGLWPVYTGSTKPDLAGKTSWHWDGVRAHPTLQPSIRHVIHSTVKGDYDSLHGWLKGGQWIPC